MGDLWWRSSFTLHAQCEWTTSVKLKETCESGSLHWDAASTNLFSLTFPAIGPFTAELKSLGHVREKLCAHEMSGIDKLQARVDDSAAISNRKDVL